MLAIIPVAGSGTRLRPLTHTKPKALLHVGAKPILAHIMDSLIPLGCKRFVLIISSDGGNIPLFVKNKYPDVEVHEVVQEERLGLGHAVSLTRDLAEGEELVIMYGDTIIDGDFTDFIDRGRDGVIAVKEVEDPRRFGVVNVDDGVISKFVEKPAEPQSNLAIVGFNYIKSSKNLFDALDEIIEKDVMTKGEYQITDAFQVMVEKGLKLSPFSIRGWFDCGTPKTLIETNRYMLEQEGGAAEAEDSIIIPPVYISGSATVRQSVIGPYVSVGDEAVIEKAVVSDSIIGGGARVENACLRSSLIGDNAQVVERPRVLAIGDNSSLDFEFS